VNTSFATELGAQWLDSADEFVGRAGWNVQIAKIIKGEQDGMDYASYVSLSYKTIINRIITKRDIEISRSIELPSFFF
jgi:hypothetical protein